MGITKINIKPNDEKNKMKCKKKLKTVRARDAPRYYARYSMVELEF